MALNLIYVPFSERPDESTWVDATGYLMPDGGIISAVMFLILGLMTAFSLFPREFDEKTIEFFHPCRSPGLQSLRLKPFLHV